MRRASENEAQPRRGDVWRVDLEPTVGSEIQSAKSDAKGKTISRTRPVLVLSRPRIGEKSVALCAPITEFLPERDGRRFWRVPIGDTEGNGLSKMSCIDVSQTKALDTARFQSQTGRAHGTETQGAAEALALCVGVNPQREDEGAISP